MIGVNLTPACLFPIKKLFAVNTAASPWKFGDYLYFYKLIGISSPAAVHFNGAPFLWCCHPQDAI